MGMKLALAVAPRNALLSAFVVFRDKLERNIEKAAALGYDGVELALLHREQVDLPSLRKVLERCNMEIPMISTGQIFADTGVSFTDEDPTVRDKAVEDFIGLMELASELGSMINIGRLRGCLKDGSEKASVDRFRGCMDRVLQRSDELGVNIALEPVNRYEINFLNSCQECSEMIASIDHPHLTMMPDLFHMNIEDPSIEGALWKYASTISYIHFADSNRWAPGHGHMDFKSIIAALKGSSYDGYLTVEILPYPDPDQAALEALTTLRKYI